MAAKKGSVYVNAPEGMDVVVDRNNSSPNVTPTTAEEGQNQPVDTRSDDEKMGSLLERTSQRLLKINTVFPFDFFPDTLILDERRLILVYRLFFFTNHIVSIFLEDIRTVQVVTGLLFSSMTFEIEGYEENPPPIKFLWNGDALRARRIIIGIQTATREKIDLTKFGKKDLVSKLEELGKAREAPDTQSA